MSYSPLPNHPQITRAYELADQAHKDQVRKYTNAPYIEHPYEVATLVASVGGTTDMICAGLLHDVLEDTRCGPKAIEAVTSSGTLYLVTLLTTFKLDGESRADRLHREAQRLLHGPAEAKTVKLADRW